jgi:tRNA dimethylallyltransferase
MQKQKLIVVLGPTATGKSDLAVKIAKDFDGEIISADSRQVYKGLDIGSGKITKEEMEGVPHYLLDVASPKRAFSVAQFKKLAERTIKKISYTPSSSPRRRGSSPYKIPIICGGTGFYIDAVVNDLNFPKVKPNAKLRKELEKKSLEDLQRMLKKLDRDRFEEIDQQNKVRLVRAIEIAKSLGKVPKLRDKGKGKRDKYDTLFIGIDFDDETLKHRIRKRILARMDGMKKEVKKLRKSNLSFKLMEALGLEYRNLSLLEQKKITESEFVDKLFIEIWHFAKRQRTWFKRNKKTFWSIPPKYSEVKKIVKKFTCG